MSSAPTPTYRRYPPRKGDPEWDVALFFPPHGDWTEADYLALPTNRLVELSDGSLDIPPVPTELHQLLVFLLAKALDRFAQERRLGLVLFAPHPVRLWPGKMREPDVMLMRAENAHRRKGTHWEGADLVMEIVSADDPARDLKVKRAEYGRAGIPEYWIVDPAERCITVLALDGTEYRVHGEFRAGDAAESALLPGFSVDVDACFAAAGAS